MTQNERNSFIIEMYSRGITYAKIGKLLGLTRERIRQIVNGYRNPKTPEYTEIPKGWTPKGSIDSSGIRLEGLEGKDFLREIVRRRDNHTCQICFKQWVKGKRRFDTHHLDEGKEGYVGEKYENNKDFDRMITLCHKCHLRLDSVRGKMSIGGSKNWELKKGIIR